MRADDLAALYDAACQARPTVRVSAAQFTAALAGRERVGHAHPGDLLLAVGCALGEPGALAVLEAEVMTPLRGLLRAIERDADLIDELVQRVRTRVLIGEAGAPPRIASYAGDGSLLGWLKVMAVRLHANHVRDRGRAPVRLAVDDDELDQRAVASVVPERALLGQRFGAAVARAVRAALTSLPARERALVRLHYGEGVALDRIGKIYGVHKGTVSRWLATTRERLLDAIVAQVAVGAGADRAEVIELCRELISRLELTLSAMAPAEVDGGVP